MHASKMKLPAATCPQRWRVATAGWVALQAGPRGNLLRRLALAKRFGEARSSSGYAGRVFAEFRPAILTRHSSFGATAVHPRGNLLRPRGYEGQEPQGFLAKKGKKNKTGGKLKKIWIGAIPKSAHIRNILEKDDVLLGTNNPTAGECVFDKTSGSLLDNRVAMVMSSRLRRDFIVLDDLGAQDFIVYSPDEQNLLLCGGTPQGVFYAVQTLLNHLYCEGDKVKLDDLHTGRLPIFSRPTVPIRGICTNIGGPDHLSHNQWEEEWGKDEKYDYKGFIDWLAQYKINHIDIWLFEFGFGIAYPSGKFPECVNPYHPNVKHEFVGDMIDYAHSKHMKVTMFTDFPDMFSGILRKHPELGAKQFAKTQLPSEEDWNLFQKTGENPNKHDFRSKFGTACASNPKVMTFWEEYLEEVFARYPGLDGITGQFAEDQFGKERFNEICHCANCRKNFLGLQWKYFKRMAEIVQKDRPNRLIINCASPGDVEILRHRNEIKNFIHLDWGTPFLPYTRGRALPRGEWYLFHYFGSKWTEFNWQNIGRFLGRSGLEAVIKRTVAYKPRTNDHFAFGEFTWNPELSIEDYARLYTRMTLRKTDKDTANLYAHWIKVRGYGGVLQQLAQWKKNKWPYSVKDIDRDYPRLLKEETKAVSVLLKKIKKENIIVKEIKEAFHERQAAEQK